jgi:putative ABC transport system permease protein
VKYAFATIRFDWRRYLAAILAVAVSTALIGLQVGIMLGLVSLVSIPIDRSRAEIWIASPNTRACDLAPPISREWINRLHLEPDIAATDELIQNYAFWKHPALGNVLTIILGCNLDDSSLGPVSLLTAEQRTLLTETGAVIVDISERRRLGIEEIGQTGEIFGKRVRIVGFTTGMSSITGPYILCSLQTARDLLGRIGYDVHTATYILARCKDRAAVPRVLAQLRRHSDISVFEAQDFSEKSQWFWLSTTKAGLAVGFVAFLGLLVGAIITSQSLYSATVALARELALLRALGASRRPIIFFVMQQAFLVGIAGVVLGLLLMEALAGGSRLIGANTYLAWWLRLSASAITMLMAMCSGVFALSSLRGMDPVQLLR